MNEEKILKYNKSRSNERLLLTNEIIMTWLAIIAEVKHLLIAGQPSGIYPATS